MKYLCLLLFVGLITSCTSSTSSTQEKEVLDPDANIPAEGFDLEGSNPIAVMIADKVMTAMGGRAAWDRTRYLTWNFFGARKLLWDKHEGKARIKSLRNDLEVIVDLQDKTGKVWMEGMEQNHPDTLTKYLEWGYRVWINDSYWLVMPFKMKDTGVSLAYHGEGETDAGEACDIVRLSFANVGVTPDNSYLVWVSKESDLIKQWAYFRQFEDEEPAFVLPWDNYQQMGGILLSDDRGDRDLSDLAVLESVPDGIFEQFDVPL